MAKTIGVWGIDIGRCALKALRCRLDGDNVVADAFDYIEYPKLLTQPEADAPQLVKEAIEQFLSRNTVKGDRVAISVSGESGLARYFKPPPVDAKKIADIVKYEARQQIPFALEDVIWDYQRMAGAQEVDGYVLESEIGLFAMKREQVAKALTPFKNAGIEVDIIQLAPIAIYNYLAYDFLKPLPEGQEYNPEDPPPSTVALSIGTDTTDLVVTNGYRVWQRNIPLGGNHFTKQLSKDLKLTFAKAEHLKRNPRQADDPKAIFQAMRPVFGDLVTEVQRSVGFFQSLDRKAKIANVVMLGNTVKLPGLAQYLSKHLGYEVKEVDSYRRLSGSGVVSSPAFKDNVLTFATCYGLCLQGLGKSKLATNLLPREIMTERMIRAKKPWAVGAMAALIFGLGLNYVLWYRTLEQVHPEHEVNQVKWSAAASEAESVQTFSTSFLTQDKQKVDLLEKIKSFGQEVVGTGDRQLLWLELLRAINASLPVTNPQAPSEVPDFRKVPINKRQELYLEYVETEYFDDLSRWWSNPDVQRAYLGSNPNAAVAAGGAPGGEGTTAGATGSATPGTTPGVAPPPAVGGSTGATATSIPGPSGPGWIVELAGYHYYNDRNQPRLGGRNHVIATLINNLENGQIVLPGENSQPTLFTMDELGIGYVILASNARLREEKVPNPTVVLATNQMGAPAAGFGAGAGDKKGAKDKEKDKSKAAQEDPNNPAYFTLSRYDFIVQFVWQEKPLNVRLEERRKKAEEAAKAAPSTTATPPAAPPGTAVPGTPSPATTQPASTPATTPPAATLPATSPASLPADTSGVPAPPAGQTPPDATQPAPSGTPAPPASAPATPASAPTVPDPGAAPPLPSAPEAPGAKG